MIVGMPRILLLRSTAKAILHVTQWIDVRAERTQQLFGVNIAIGINYDLYTILIVTNTLPSTLWPLTTSRRTVMDKRKI